MKKQIEEMALTLSEGGCGNECDCIQGDKFNCHLLHSASVLYNAGYRKQKEGEWVERIENPDWLEDDVDVFYECSVCETKSPAPTNYCPNCGSEMKGGAE